MEIAETIADEQAGAPASAAPSGAPRESERLPLRTKLLFGGPNLAAGAMVLPIVVNMPKFYADVVLVPLGYLAMAIAFARTLDAISDPLIGWISDRTHSRWGRRRPYIFIGAPLAGVAFWAVMTPRPGMTGGTAALWFLVTIILCSLFLTVALLPHDALAPELTLDYNERSGLYGICGALGILGTMVAAVAPGVMIQRSGLSERQAFSHLGVVFGVLLVILCWLMVAFIRERPEFVTRESNPLVPGVRRAFRNRPFRILLTCFVASSISGGIPAILMPFFNAYVVQPAHPQLWLSLQLLGFFGVSFFSMPFAVAAARRFGKLPTWLACHVIGISTELLIFFLVGKGDNVLYLILNCWGAISFGANVFLPGSMAADVIDYDELHTGRRREAQYGAFWNILPKFIAIPSAAIPISILASLGYVPNAAQSPRVIFTIRVLYALAPLLSSVLSFAVACMFPINARNHAAMLDGIERHKRGENAVDPLTGRDVPPSNERAADEAAGWFLDNFSQRELRRFLSGGPLPVIWGIVRATAISIAICIAAAWITLRQIAPVNADPGALASLSIVVAGSALTVSIFHLMRIGPARRLAAVAPEMVQAHLNDCDAGCI